MKINPAFLVWTVLLTSVPALAQSSGTMSFEKGGRDYPLEVSLASEFPTQVCTQIGGTCHVFAAATLYEHACLKRTGKRVRISRAYLFYLHLIHQMMEPEEMDQLLFKVPSNPLLMSALDGGYPEKNIPYLLKYGALSEQELPLDREFERMFKTTLESERARFRRLKNELKKNKLTKQKFAEKQQILLNDAPERIHSAIRTHIIAKLAKNGGSLSEYTAQSSDPGVRACTGLKYKFVHKNWQNFTITIEDQVRWISEGRPFICSAKFSFGETDEPGYHASTVIGYRYNDKFPNHLEWQLQDSNVAEPSWGWKDVACEDYLFLW